MMTLHSLKLFLLKSGVPNWIVITACAAVIAVACLALWTINKRQ